MATSKSNRRARSGTNPSPELILRNSVVSKCDRHAWKAAKDETDSLRFPAYRHLYMLNLYAEKMIGLLRELDGTMPSGYQQTLIQQVRSEVSQKILEMMDGVESTDSFLCDALRDHFENEMQR